MIERDRRRIRRYTPSAVEYYVAKAVAIGRFDEALAQLKVPRSTLYSWLKWKGYRLRDGLIYRP